MTSELEEAGIGSFTCAFGDIECKPEDIPDFDALWDSVSFGTDFADMGSATYRKMSGPIEQYVVAAVRRTLQSADVSPATVEHIVFAASDPTLALLPIDFTTSVLRTVGLEDCVPHLVSYQRCCSSLTALQHGWNLLGSQPNTTHAVVVALDFIPDDRDRLRSYAVFGDGVASCLLSTRAPGLLRLVSSATHVDPDGLRGEDTFATRQKVAARTLAAVLESAGRKQTEIKKVFASNLHKPLALFNASSIGFRADAMHFLDTLAAYGHCGNADWLINLADYHERTGIQPGETYLAQSQAPGFYSCALLEGSPRS